MGAVNQSVTTRLQNQNSSLLDMVLVVRCNTTRYVPEYRVYPTARYSYRYLPMPLISPQEAPHVEFPPPRPLKNFCSAGNIAKLLFVFLFCFLPHAIKRSLAI